MHFLQTLEYFVQTFVVLCKSYIVQCKLFIILRKPLIFPCNCSTFCANYAEFHANCSGYVQESFPIVPSTLQGLHYILFLIMINVTEQAVLCTMRECLISLWITLMDKHKLPISDYLFTTLEHNMNRYHGSQNIMEPTHIFFSF